ncbi:cell division control protein 6 [Methanocella sp. CWC-04]|uniref:ORC1-type DNA replication protein n=1 Tax=Methanooceanicella nereidis TaxID=2052831 RepID=A0AAP2RDL4_9EURY|nr:cell division control protein 6 [Methanocella sp. CWC-04]
MNKDLLLWDQTIFRDEQYFELDYLPENLLHRDSQMRSVMFSVAPALRGATPLNVYCRGSPGTGKTSVVLKVFKELENTTQKVIPVYINCQVDSTRYAIFSQIFKKLFGYPPPSSGISFKKLFSQIAKHLVEKKKVLIVALDDVNYLMMSKEVNDVLYSLLRMHEVVPGTKVGVIAILSDLTLDMARDLDPQVQSVLLPEEVSFPKYSRSEIRDILSHRVKYGFYPNVVSDELLELVTQYTEETGDLRVGINVLKRAGLNAERRASKIVSREDVEKAYEGSRYIHLNYTVRNLKKEEKVLLKCIIDSGKYEMMSGELFECFKGNTGLGYTSFYEMVNRLEGLKLVNVDTTGKGTRGQSRLVSLKYDPKEVEKRLDI